MKVDKTLVASVVLHVVVLGWGLFSFTSRAYESVESVPIEFVTDDQLAKATAGTKSGKKENPKPLVEKVAEAKPVDDSVGKISEKPPVLTDTAAPPPPKADEKPAEKKPEPAKPVTESKPTEQSKQPEPPKIDPQAEAVKKEEKKPPKPKPKPQDQASKPPQAAKPKPQRPLDVANIEALLRDHRDPTRQAYAGAEPNLSASLGAAQGTAAKLSQSEMGAMRALLKRLWTLPDGVNPEDLTLTVRISLNPDRRLAAVPQVVASGSSPRAKAAAESAVRAILQGQPFTMLRDETYQQWKFMDIDFGPEM